MAKYKSYLTSEESEKSYSKYFNRKPADPPAESLATMEKPIDPVTALQPENMNDLLTPEKLASESGWCVMPDGSGYVSNIMKMPGVTVDMINWWFAWHPLEPLRYKIWWPEDHYDLKISEEARERILNPAVPASLNAKNYRVCHNVTEDIGSGAENIHINFMSPESFGFDIDRVNKMNGITLILGVGFAKSTKAPASWLPAIPSIMCHFIREAPDGIELRSRFWMGYAIIDRKPKKKLPSFMKVPKSKPRGLAIHNVYEYHNLASFLPQIYKEQNGIIS